MEPLRLMDESSRSYWHSLFAWDSMLFFFVCSLDMLSTLLWVQQGVAKEANPWLAECMRVSPLCFCAAKSISYVPVLLICAYYRSTYPRCVALGLRWGVFGYIALYAIGVGIQFLRYR